MGGTTVVADTPPPGRHRRGHLASQPRTDRRRGRVRLTRIMVIGAVVVTAAAIALVSSLHGRTGGGGPADSTASRSATAPPKPKTLLGIYVPGVPQSYAGVRAFTATTGVKPGVVLYYSGWLEPFQVRFAEVANEDGAMPLVQIDPTGISLAAIASGKYDSYLRSFASAVKNFGGGVIVSFA